MSILIAEDNDISAEILGHNLRQQNYQAVRVRSGLEALDALKQDATIQLVIADIKMPEMDGMELLRRMKENPTFKKIPVILCTAMADAEHVRRACALGCRHYLVKPIQRSTLLQKVAEALGENPQTLLDKELIKSKFGMDEDSYARFAAAILRFLEEQLAL